MERVKPSRGRRCLLAAAIVLWATAAGAAKPGSPCPTTPLERSTLFFPPKGMTLVCDVVDLFQRDTPGGGVPYNALTIVDEEKRNLRIALTLMAGQKDAKERIFAGDWGFIVDCGRIHGLTFREVPESPGARRTSKVGVMSCAMCHTGRVAGRVLEGLGNKRIDVFTIGRDGHALQKQLVRLRGFSLRRRGSTSQAIDANALQFTERLADVRLANRTVGLVPDAHITQWIYDESGGGQPPNAPRGEMKIPAVWNLAGRRGQCNATSCEVGLFADAFGTGRGWIGGAVLGAGQDRKVVGSASYQAAVAEAEKAMLALQGPPPYPCPVDAPLAERGRALFTEKGCARCHETRPGFAPHTVPVGKVRTDPDRLLLLGTPPGSDGAYGAETRRRMDVISAQIPRLQRARFADLDPGGDVTHGYIAPRLEGIWARFPYLHNGSVPTLDDLLSAPEDRPAQFDLTYVETRTCFDPVRVGLRDSATCRPNLARWSRPADPETFETDPGLRNVYDTRRSGHRNIGHDFWRDPVSGAWTLDADMRAALIEYLKTLGGTHEDPTWCPPRL